MKIVFTVLALISIQTSFASDVQLCKNEALKAAYERYTYEFPESIISIRALGKPVVDGAEIYHSVQVVDLESGQKIAMGVITEKNSCRIIAVN